MKNSVLHVAPVALLLAAGCTEILNIDVHYDDGGGGTGPSNGGNGASVSDGGNGAGPSDGGNGAGPTTGGNGGEGTGGSSPYCTVADEFNVDGDVDAGCWAWANEGLVTTQVTNDELHIRPNASGPSTGWYDTNMGYLLYRSLPPGEFAVVSKVQATSKTGDGPPAASGSYHVGGLIVRDPVTFDWVKLEVGYREDSALFDEPYGLLAAITVANNTDHVEPYNEDHDIAVELGICRDSFDGILLFVRNAPGDKWQQITSGPLGKFQLNQGVQVGMSATAYNGPGSDIDGRFDYIRFAEDVTIASPADCEGIITELANQSDSGDCGCP